MLFHKRFANFVCAVAITAIVGITTNAAAQSSRSDNAAEIIKIYESFADKQRFKFDSPLTKRKDLKILAKDYCGKPLSDYYLIIALNITGDRFYTTARRGTDGIFIVPSIPMQPGTEVMISISMLIYSADANERFDRGTYGNFYELAGSQFIKVGIEDSITLEVNQASVTESVNIGQTEHTKDGKEVGGNVGMTKGPARAEVHAGATSGGEATRTKEETYAAARPSKTLVIKQRFVPAAPTPPAASPSRSSGPAKPEVKRSGPAAGRSKLPEHQRGKPSSRSRR